MYVCMFVHMCLCVFGYPWIPLSYTKYTKRQYSLRRSIDKFADAVTLLERDQGAAWKLIFKLLARGRLFDNDKDKPLKITGSRLLREHKELFVDTYGPTDVAP
jgi:hypothetical protein